MKTLFLNLLWGLSAPLFVITVSGQERAARENYQLPEYKIEDISELPVPYITSVPTIQRGLIGTTIALKFTVNKRGEAENVHSAIPLFALGLVEPKVRDFACQMTSCVSTWKFKPALDARGQPVTVKVLLPVEVVGNGKTAKQHASLAVTKPVVLAMAKN